MGIPSGTDTGRDDRVFYIDRDAILRDPQASVVLPEGAAELTRTGLAIRHALAHARPERQMRLLALTDGFSTESLTPLAEPLARAKAPLDYRLALPQSVQDIRIEAFTLPARAQPGEAFVMELRAASTLPVSEPVRFEIRRDEALIHEGELRFPASGRTTVARFSDRVF